MSNTMKDYVNTLPMLTLDKPKTIPIQLLVEHVNLRAEQLGFEMTGMTVQSVGEWVAASLDQQAWQDMGMIDITSELTQAGATMVALSLKEPLMSLVNADILALFHGAGAVRQMVNANHQLYSGVDTELDGPFHTLSFNPLGDDQVHLFPSGVRKISSLYLSNVMAELSQTDSSITPSQHKNILRAIKREFEFVSAQGVRSHESAPLSHSCYEMEEATYNVQENNAKPHIWMSPDLCLFVAAKYSGHIRARIIDDLNRVQFVVETQNNIALPPVSLPNYLPGTPEHLTREHGLMDALTGQRLGYFAMSRVMRLWSDQLNKPVAEFEQSFDMRIVYGALHELTFKRGMQVVPGASFAGGTVSLFPLEVLREYFTGINFDALTIE